MSSLEWLEYKIKDIFGAKTYAESQQKKYRDMVQELEGRLMSLEVNIPYVMESYQTDYGYMELNPQSAEGKLSDVFAEKEEKNRGFVDHFHQKFREAFEEINSQLIQLQQEEAYWISEVEREDREMKIYEEKYYEEKIKEE